MDYVFSVRVFEQKHPESHEMQYHALSIEAFHFYLELDVQDRTGIKVEGLEAFLKNLLYDLLEEQQDHGGVYESPRKIETITQSLINFSTNRKVDRQQGLLISIEINNYIPKNRRCDFFERITPWLVGVTTIAEMILGVILGFFWQEYAQGANGLVPMDANANFGLSLSSSVLSLFWMLWDFFTDGQIVFMRDSGANMDKQCHRLIDKWNGHQAVVCIDIPESVNGKGKKIGVSLRFFFMLALLNGIYETITSTYSSISITANIEAERLQIPTNIYLALNYLQIALAHIDDPVIWCSGIYLGFIVIDIVMAKYWPAAIEAMPASGHLHAIESQRLDYIKNRQALRVKSGIHESESVYRPLADQPLEAHYDERSLINTHSDEDVLSPRQRIGSPSH